ncbi:MAG TPA: hypothetical protein VNI77_04815, partial [Nitrososphaera sp.]|nr:hypothetical protein [Nitrososphaera sp.]
RSFAHSLIHSFTHSLIRSFAHSLIHSFTHSLIHSFTLPPPSLPHSSFWLPSYQKPGMGFRRGTVICTFGRNTMLPPGPISILQVSLDENAGKRTLPFRVDEIGKQGPHCGAGAFPHTLNSPLLHSPRLAS